MSKVSLDEAKTHLRVSLSDLTHDTEVQRLINSSEAWAANLLNRDLTELDDNSPPDSPFTLPDDLKTAILLHIEAHFDRDPQSMQGLIEAAINMAYPYRVNIGV